MQTELNHSFKNARSIIVCSSIKYNHEYSCGRTAFMRDFFSTWARSMSSTSRTHFPCIIRKLEYLSLQVAKRLPLFCVLAISFQVHFATGIYDCKRKYTVNPMMLRACFVFFFREIKRESFGGHRNDKQA